MKLVTFSKNEILRSGVLSKDRVQVPHDLPPMRDLITNWDDWSPLLASCVDDQCDIFSLDEVKLVAPIPNPRKILALGLNYLDHIEEAKLPVPSEQVWFCKQPSAVNGPYAPVRVPQVSEQLDYEAELVVIIGRRCRDIDEDKAMDAVFGYCVGNDFSVRDWQLRTSQWMLGKSFDTHAPFGPWIVTTDELPDPNGLDISCTVNGAIKQQSNTRHMLFKIPQMIAHLSQVMTLEPGDLIFTGTPGGVAIGDPDPQYLKAGDVVCCSIAGIGQIRNEVV